MLGLGQPLLLLLMIYGETLRILGRRSTRSGSSLGCVAKCPIQLLDRVACSRVAVVSLLGGNHSAMHYREASRAAARITEIEHSAAKASLQLIVARLGVQFGRDRA
jgi:hypothetical protein